MTRPNPKTPGPLTAAAAALDAELVRYEELSRGLAETPLDSQKNLQRSKNAMEECAESERRLSAALATLLEAMNAAQKRQERAMQETLSAAQRVQARVSEFAAFMERFAALGLRARDLNVPVAEILEKRATGGDAGDLLGGLKDVVEKMTQISEDAEAAAKDAQAAGWVDVARDADALKQQVQSAKNKVVLAQGRVAARAPS
jgi:hypothetical protein